MFINGLYWQLKPLIPRRLQIEIRRMIVRRKRMENGHIWPIDERASRPPDGWKGWPEGKKFCLVLTHDVEDGRGLASIPQLAELERRLGFRSSFNFIAEAYQVPAPVLQSLTEMGFETGLHGLKHRGNLFETKESFAAQAQRINHYLRKWKMKGFRAPSMFHNYEMISDLDIEYDSSTFDTDPFEPQPDGVETIFPFCYRRPSDGKCFVELPYTLPQDFTLFVLMEEKGIDIWKKKLDWIVEKGGMALVITHPDYMNFDSKDSRCEEYAVANYEELLKYVETKHRGTYWHALPKDVARFWADTYGKNQTVKQPGTNSAIAVRPMSHAADSDSKKIWIDLDNSPHVPFFSPIIGELNKLGYQVLLTARNCSQTCGLADLFGLKYKRIGRHYGKHMILKVAGTVFRALQLMGTAKKEGPVLALSYGSRAQMLSAWMLRIPSIVIMDYEHVKGFLRPTWIMMPEIITGDAIKHDKERLLKYPGIKEDVYVPTFKPDPRIKDALGLREDDLVVTVRPPATEAHYHNSESERLFSAVVNLLGAIKNVRMVLLPRNDAQKAAIQDSWGDLCATKKIIIPEQIVDGLNLLWHSDLVISGGGTMNREAAALGVPVYSIFRGKIGAVDRYLVKSGRLTLLESIGDVQTKLVLAKRSHSSGIQNKNGKALNSIVEGIIKALKSNLQNERR